jgi:hypothetical protein
VFGETGRVATNDLLYLYSLTNATGPGITIANNIVSFSTNGWVFGLSSNEVLNIMLGGTALNASNWLGWVSASNWLHTVFYPLSNPSNYVSLALVWSAGGITNNGNATLNILNAGTISANTGTFTTLRAGNLTVNNDLTVNGTTIYNDYQYVVITSGTNYVQQTIYSTNVSYTTYYVITNAVVTNTVNTYINIGGSFTMGSNSTFIASNAASLYFPNFIITNNYLRATNTWDWSNAIWVNPPTNGWTFGTPNAITNASGPGITVNDSIITLSTNGWVFGTLGAVTNSTSNVSGLTLTTTNGITTLGGALPEGMSTGQVQGIVGAMGLASTNVSQAIPSGTGSLMYSNNQFYFTPPSAAGLGSVTNVNITVNTSGGLTIDGGTSKMLTNGGSYTLTASGGGLTNIALSSLSFSIPSDSTAARVGVGYDMTQVVTNDTLRKRAVAFYDTWTTNQFAVDSAAYSGTITGSVLVLLNPVAGTTNWPTSFTHTSTVTIVSGQLDWSASINVPNGLYDIQLLVNSPSGRTNLVRNLLRRQAP